MDKWRPSNTAWNRPTR